MKSKIKDTAKKIVEDQKNIKLYLKGKIDKEELRKRGVSLAMPV